MKPQIFSMDRILPLLSESNFEPGGAYGPPDYLAEACKALNRQLVQESTSSC